MRLNSTLVLALLSLYVSLLKDFHVGTRTFTNGEIGQWRQLVQEGWFYARRLGRSRDRLQAKLLDEMNRTIMEQEIVGSAHWTNQVYGEKKNFRRRMSVVLVFHGFRRPGFVCRGKLKWFFARFTFVVCKTLAKAWH